MSLKEPLLGYHGELTQNEEVPQRERECGMNAYSSLDFEEGGALGSVNYDLIVSNSINRNETRKEEDEMEEEAKEYR
jgi:hypothetical protein